MRWWREWLWLSSGSTECRRLRFSIPLMGRNFFQLYDHSICAAFSCKNMKKIRLLGQVLVYFPFIYSTRTSTCPSLCNRLFFFSLYASYSVSMCVCIGAKRKLMVGWTLLYNMLHIVKYGAPDNINSRIDFDKASLLLSTLARIQILVLLLLSIRIRPPVFYYNISPTFIRAHYERILLSMRLFACHERNVRIFSIYCRIRTNSRSALSQGLQGKSFIVLTRNFSYILAGIYTKTGWECVESGNLVDFDFLWINADNSGNFYITKFILIWF